MNGWTAGNPTGHTPGVRRAAQLRTCPTCHAHILRGLDHDICALDISCDTAPLTTQSEAIALLTGRATYDAETTGLTIHLEHRHQFRIRAPRQWTILAQHACPGTPLDLTWLPSRTHAELYPDDNPDPPF